MKLVAAILVLVVAGLAFQLHRQQLTIRQQQVRLAELTTKIAVSEANAKSNSLEYQEKCAEQARKAFHDLGYKPNDTAEYENHYNTKLNKCFVFVQNTDATHQPTIWTYKTLFDAYAAVSYTHLTLPTK